MALERRDPIPLGTYWIDVVKDHSGFLAWLKKNANTVKVLKHRDDEKDFRWWFLFEVLSPTKRWPLSVRIGAPTIAPQGAKTTKAKTAQRPKAKGVADYWGDKLPEIATTPMGMIAILGLIWAFNRR